MPLSVQATVPGRLQRVGLDKAYVFKYVTAMTTLTASAARSRLYKLLDETADSHEPIQITGRRANAVLLSEEDWRAIQETLYLLSVPGMRESIRKGLQTPAKRCLKKLRW